MTPDLAQRIIKILTAHHEELGKQLVGARAYRDTHAEAALLKQRAEIIELTQELGRMKP